jgi:hypothetical protein
MKSVVSVFVLCSLSVVQIVAPAAKAQTANQPSGLNGVGASLDTPELPPAPRGKSTILGGEIRKIDTVRDELTLKVVGQRSQKILFDERTQVFRDGGRVPLVDLRAAPHASVQTVLDGTNVFALSIHLLSRFPEGEYQGSVLNYNPSSNELTISSVLSRTPFKLLVPANILIQREGQSPFSSMPSGVSDLVKGALVSVSFESGKEERGVASEIGILAIPGSAFSFSGNISSIDMHSGILVLLDPRDDKTYRVLLATRDLATAHDLHQGDSVNVRTVFDGSNYVANAISLN